MDPPATHVPTPAEAAAMTQRNTATAAVLLAAAGAAYIATRARSGDDHPITVKPPTEQHLINWSGTHECDVQKYYQPESIAELEALVKQANDSGQTLRCVGSGLSPNALGFEERGVVSLALLDKVLYIDHELKQVTVQAGARVQEVADHLRKHGLTLQNYASIREQTIGGFTQVSAHGTGARIPPVDETVVALKVVTPGAGTLRLSADQDPELFKLARVGLGCLGVVAEVTLQCVPRHRLVERTFVATPAEVHRQHASWLKENKHLRYMWIPSTDAVVVVQCNEEGSEAAKKALAVEYEPQKSSGEPLEPFRRLLRQRESIAIPEDEIEGMSATQCRDALLAASPLDAKWVAEVNSAEAKYWLASAGTRTGWSDEILGFDCGGQQWVLEVAFPCGTTSNPSGADLRYMRDLLGAIKRHGIPAPAPIEQRWTSGSSSPMSPASGPLDSLYSWVGIIMYLDGDDVEQRREVTAAFKKYGKVVERDLLGRYDAVEHWAKIEVPEGRGAPEELRATRKRLANKYPLRDFNEARRRLDPKGILGNDLIDALLRPE